MASKNKPRPSPLTLPMPTPVSRVSESSSSEPTSHSGGAPSDGGAATLRISNLGGEESAGSSANMRASGLAAAAYGPNRTSTGPIDVDEVQRQLKAQQDLEEGQRQKLMEFVAQKQNIDELCGEHLILMRELGKGNGGVVTLVQHTPTNLVMARKSIHLDIKQAVRQQIIRELQVLHDCNSPYIVGYYGAFLHSNNISILMEYMNGGSLDLVLRAAGRLPEPIVSRITWAVLKGLKYLRESLHIIHRDVKPSNILVNREGDVKLCDFGVSGKLIDSIACSFVGTRSYMSPERINGQEYNIRSDVWSLGLSLIEMVTGRYPIPSAETEDYLSVFSPDRNTNMREQEKAALEGIRLEPVKSRGSGPLAIFELLSYIVDNPPPSLPEFCFSPDLCDFVDKCLHKVPNERLNLDGLLEHAFVCNSGAGQHYSLEVDLKRYLPPILGPNADVPSATSGGSSAPAPSGAN